MRKKTIENYLKLVYNLQKANKRVHTNDIAYFLGINPASVTEIFQKLSDEGYINYEKYSGVTLTDKGRRLARQIIKKHDALKEFLLLFEIDEKIAEHDACDMEHVLHPTTLDMIVKFVEVINQCKLTPIWLQRLRKYCKTGNLNTCPTELIEVCLKYAKSVNVK